MKRCLTSLLRAGVAGVLFAGGAALVGGSPAGATTSAQFSNVVLLSIHITATPASPTIWGTVTATFKSGGKKHSLSPCPPNAHPTRSTCSYDGIPKGVSITFTEKPKDSSTWPFKEWQVKQGTATTTTASKTSITVTMNKGATVTAVYTLP